MWCYDRRASHVRPPVSVDLESPVFGREERVHREHRAHERAREKITPAILWAHEALITLPLGRVEQRRACTRDARPRELADIGDP